MSSVRENDNLATAGASGAEAVRAVAARLRARRATMGGGAAVSSRAETAIGRVWEMWRARLASGWEPQAAGGGAAAESFPWAQVRVSLAGLIQPSPPVFVPLVSTSLTGEEQEAGADALVALVLAGNTPLLGWPALCAALLAGKAVFVKMSRNETLWPRLFWETLRDADADLAGLVHLDVWPGDDARTEALLAVSDVVIAYGGDGALAALQANAGQDAPFYGFGHAVSVGVVLADADLEAAAHGFARDVLMYDQGGCLSPQVVFVEDGGGNGGDAGNGRALEFAERLAAAFPAAVDALHVSPSSDAGRARAVRQARQMALFTPQTRVLGDAALRWTVLAHTQTGRAGEPMGFGVVPVIPVQNAVTHLGDALGALRGSLSSVGVAGTVTSELRDVLGTEGATRICAPGAMQAPPLDWRNGGVDLFGALRLS